MASFSSVHDPNNNILCYYVTIESRGPRGFSLPGHLDQLLVVDHLDVGVEQRHHAVHRLQVHAPVTRQVQVAHLQGVKVQVQRFRDRG